MKNGEKLNIDNILLGGALLYIIIPILIFFWGWLKLPVAILTSIVFMCFALSLWKNILPSTTGLRMFVRSNTKFWIAVILIIFVWVFFSGIGEFTYQNDDFWVRNPIFRDLSEQEWPVIYDLSKESETVQNICGSEKVAFSYYFCWWLPVALLSKIFHLSTFVRNASLYLWAAIGIFEIVFLLCRKIRKCSWLVPVVMICFSGLDIVGWGLKNTEGFTLMNHLEWWADYFQYSSNTTQLYWVFNQSIPIWVIMALILQLDSGKFIAALGALSFAYSPWATFGMVPYVMGITIKRHFQEAINTLNVIVPIIMMIVFGTFYLASSGSDGFIGTIFSYHPDDDVWRIIVYYIAFVFLEFGIYFLLMRKVARKYECYWITLAELLLFPLFIIRDFNFIIRGSIPALFLLMYYVIRFLMEKDIKETVSAKRKLTISKKILIVAMCIGAITPLCELERSIFTTIATNDYLQENVYSFANIKTEDINRITTIKSQFFIYDYENTLFFKYLAR